MRTRMAAVETILKAVEWWPPKPRLASPRAAITLETDMSAVKPVLVWRLYTSQS